MATKPTARPRWANAGGVIVEPSEGKKDIGWVDGEAPPAEFDNWFKNLAWQWTEYLGDGILSGEHRIINGGLIIEDDVSTGGNAIIGNILEVSGEADFQGPPSNFSDSINVFGDVNATGILRHGPRSLYLGAGAGVVNQVVSTWAFLSAAPGDTTGAHWNGIVANTGSVVSFAIPYNFGDHFSRIHGFIRHSTPAPIRMALQRGFTNGNNATIIPGVVTSSGPTGNQTLELLVDERATVPGFFYHVVFVNGAVGDGNADQHIYGVEVTYDHLP